MVYPTISMQKNRIERMFCEKVTKSQYIDNYPTVLTVALLVQCCVSLSVVCDAMYCG